MARTLILAAIAGYTFGVLGCKPQDEPRPIRILPTFETARVPTTTQAPPGPRDEEQLSTDEDVQAYRRWVTENSVLRRIKVGGTPFEYATAWNHHRTAAFLLFGTAAERRHLVVAHQEHDGTHVYHTLRVYCATPACLRDRLAASWLVTWSNATLWSGDIGGSCLRPNSADSVVMIGPTGKEVVLPWSEVARLAESAILASLSFASHTAGLARCTGDGTEKGAAGR